MGQRGGDAAAKTPAAAADTKPTTAEAKTETLTVVKAENEATVA